MHKLNTSLESRSSLLRGGPSKVSVMINTARDRVTSSVLDSLQPHLRSPAQPFPRGNIPTSEFASYRFVLTLSGGVLNPASRVAYMHVYNTTVEQSLGKGFCMSIAFVGNHANTSWPHGSSTRPSMTRYTVAQENAIISIPVLELWSWPMRTSTRSSTPCRSTSHTVSSPADRSFRVRSTKSCARSALDCCRRPRDHNRWVDSTRISFGIADSLATPGCRPAPAR